MTFDPYADRPISGMPPGTHASDDDTSLYLATALAIALDLSLDKIIIPSTSLAQADIRQIPKANLLEAKKALTMDGFEDIQVTSERGQRLLRRRERVWIALFVLERGVCLARGRSYCVPKTSLINYCDRWHVHNNAYIQDGPMVSMAVLRRNLDDLFADVRSRCDSYRATDAGSKASQEIDHAIDSFFNEWFNTWTSVIGDTETKTLPPYVEILVTHTRLSTYSMLLNHPSAPPEVKRSFRASALSSALNVLRAAIQGESRLKSMPNNTVTMICFAASIALALSTPVPAARGGNQNLAPSVRNLIEETATVLERIGSTPAHRNGSSVVYGRFLRVLVKQAPIFNPQAVPRNLPQPSEHQQLAPFSPMVQSQILEQNSSMVASAQPAAFWGEPLDFSAMSYNEVNETVLHSDLFSTALLDLPWDESNPLMWPGWLNPPDFNFP